jgi:tRNA(Arg) A34 adenosine deaminase TadA
MVTTLSPCDMCTGAILLHCIPRVVFIAQHPEIWFEDIGE